MLLNFLLLKMKWRNMHEKYCLNELCRAGECNSTIIPVKLDILDVASAHDITLYTLLIASNNFLYISSGASRAKCMIKAVWPQIKGFYWSTVLYCFEMNILYNLTALTFDQNEFF